jgi:hypothetical protein
MHTVKRLGAVLALAACLTICSTQATAQSYTEYFWIVLPDLDWYGGFADTGTEVLGTAVVNTKNCHIHANAKGWVWNDAWRRVQYKGISGLYFWTTIPEEILATFVCKYTVDEYGQARWSGKGCYVPPEED